MNPYKLLFLDIDGTIVTAENTVQESTKHAISQMQKKGIDVILATGRPLHEISYLAEELNVDSMIGYNGAYGIYRGKSIWKKPLSVPCIDHFLRIAGQHNHSLVLFTKDRSLWNKIDSPLSLEFMEKFHIHKNEPFTSSINEEILSVNVMTTGEDDYKMYEAFGGLKLARVNIALEVIEYCYDVVRDEANKGMAVKAFLDHLQIEKKQAIAFGDAMNDIEMLKNVGESFAMGNADPELFKFAKHKTTSVQDAGVYNGLKSLGLID